MGASPHKTNPLFELQWVEPIDIGTSRGAGGNLPREVLQATGDNMKIPQAERAIVEPSKVRDYLLSPSHPLGRFKAKFFRDLGYSPDLWPVLQRDLQDIAVSGTVAPGRPSDFGDKYEIRAMLKGPSGREAEIVTIWMVRRNEEFPRLITAFPGEQP